MQLQLRHVTIGAVLLDILNTFASKGTAAPVSGASATDVEEWLKVCGELLNQRLAQDDRLRYRPDAINPIHLRALERIRQKHESADALPEHIDRYFRALPKTEQAKLAPLRRQLIPPRDRNTPEHIRQTIRTERDALRLWRARLTRKPLDVLKAMAKNRRAEAKDRAERLAYGLQVMDPTARIAISRDIRAALKPLNMELAALCRKALRRCHYPGCDIAGGRFFVGRSRECDACRQAHSRRTGLRHRKEMGDARPYRPRTARNVH